MLNGDILEYENIGGEALTEEEAMAVEGLIVLGSVINWLFPLFCIRLSGGAGEIVNYDDDPNVRELERQLVAAGQRMASRASDVLGGVARTAVDRAGNAIVAAGKRGYNQITAYNPFRGGNKRPTVNAPVPPLRGGSNEGRAMLAWKNSLTKMYHTYQVYQMHPVLQTASTGGLYWHRMNDGQGPHLYWTFDTTLADTTNRNLNFNTAQYWDGGFGANPSIQVASPYVPAKNYKLGASGIIYVFSADWPGTTMNPDVNTRLNTNQFLRWWDVEYAGTVTTTNYPRKWVDVFKNTSWQYITIYGIQYRFDVTNLSFRKYCLEIQLFKFKADVDAMDYEKQCLAAFGGYHTGTNGYMMNMNTFPIADVNIISNKRYYINGLTTQINNDIMTEGHNQNNKTIKMNIKKTIVLKRPLLNSYETTLTEDQIFTTYYEQQKGIYFRIMAWPMDIQFYQTPTGISQMFAFDTANPNVPNVTDANNVPTRLGSGLQVTMYRKAYFKLDQATAIF